MMEIINLPVFIFAVFLAGLGGGMIGTGIVLLINMIRLNSKRKTGYVIRSSNSSR